MPDGFTLGTPYSVWSPSDFFNFGILYMKGFVMSKVVESLLDRLRKDVVLVAEGYMFELERRGYVKAGPFLPEAVLEHPSAVKQLHLEFMRSGSEVIVAFTYYGHRAKMKAMGLENLLEELNIRAVALAREVAHKGRALTAGNLSNTWEYDTKNLEKSDKVVRAIFEEQTKWAVNVGVDFMIAETFSHLGEALIALEVIKEARLPAVITFIPLQEKSCDGYVWEEACRILEENGADVVGLNCGRGPDTMIPILEKIRNKISGYMAALPVPYRTTKEQPCFYDLKMPGQKSAFPVGLDPFLLTRFEMADFAVKARNMGINYIGICCGAGPHHVRAMAEALGRSVPASKYSPELNLHPVIGYDDTTKRYCFGPMNE